MYNSSLEALAPSPLVTVCIITRNRKDDLMKALASCEAQTYQPRETVVYDGESSDGTREAVSRHFPGVRLIEVDDDPGFPALRNRALQEAEAEIVVSIDDDSYFTAEDTLRQLVKDFQANPSAAAVAIPFIAPNQTCAEGIHVNINQSSYAKLGAFTGCCCALRRRAVLNVGGYRIVPGYQKEDRDLSIRLLDAGFSIVLGKTDLAVHSFSPGRDFDRRYDQAVQTALLFDYLNVPSRYLLGRWVRDAAGLLIYMFRLSRLFRRLRAVIAGFYQCWINRSLRNPVALSTYRTYRQLPLHAPVPWTQKVPLPVGMKY